VHSNSSFEIVLFSKKLNIPARQVRAKQLVELVRIKPITIVCVIHFMSIYAIVDG
jgi:hypothetical protein